MAPPEKHEQFSDVILAFSMSRQHFMISCQCSGEIGPKKKKKKLNAKT